MKVNWGALGITIGLILVAASILAMGLVAGKSISELTARLTTLEDQTFILEEQISTIKAGIKRAVIAQGYAFSKASSEKRAITLEDLKEGYALADKL